MLYLIIIESYLIISADHDFCCWMRTRTAVCHFNYIYVKFEKKLLILASYMSCFKSGLYWLGIEVVSAQYSMVFRVWNSKKGKAALSGLLFYCFRLFCWAALDQLSYCSLNHKLVILVVFLWRKAGEKNPCYWRSSKSNKPLINYLVSRENTNRFDNRKQWVASFCFVFSHTFLLLNIF